MPGLGLGLTITQLLTNTLGGEISVRSVKDEGSTFRVRLMLSAVERTNTTPATERKIVSYTGPRRTVVVVDDNQDHRDLMREVLAPMDFVALTASDGPECLTLIEGVKPDIFLIDISMPGMSGWQLVARLRDEGQKAPIIMLSANIGDGTTAEAAGEGHDDTLSKPVNLRRLADKLASHLGLAWVYEGETPPLPIAAAKKPVRSPGTSHLQDLLRLGEIGYVRGIEAKLADLATDETNRPFADELGLYLKAFDMAGYMKFLERLDKEETSDG
jgi:CheY-like chemotaxis protein